MNAQGSSNNSNYRQYRRSSFNDSSGGRSFNESDHGLRRSFVAIHRQNNNSPTSPVEGHVMNPTSNNSNGGRSRRSSTTENTPRPRLLKKRSHRRHSMNMNSRRVSIETTHGDGQIQMPSLPFSKKAESTIAMAASSSGNRTRQPPPPPPPRSRNNGGRRDSNEQQEVLAHPPLTHHQASSRRSFHNTNKAKDRTTSTNQQDHQVRRRRSHEDEGRPTSHQGQGPSRRITISSAPTDEQLQQLRRPDTAYGHQQQFAQDHGGQEPFHKGFRPDYVLGEYSRHTSHMIMPQDDVHAIQLVNTLSKHDFAFVKRSNGNYSYAILAYRTSSYSNDDDDEKKDEGMAFVMDDSGSTKMIRRKHWCEYIRLVSMQDCSMITTPTEDQAMNNNDMDCGIEEMVYPSTHQQRTSPPTHQETQDVHHPSQDHQDSDENVVLCQEIPMVCQEIPAPHPHQHNPQASQVNSMGLRHNQDNEEDENNDDDCTAPLPEMITVRPHENNEECSLISSVSERARRVWRFENARE